MTNMNVDGMRVHNETWAQQFMDAMNVNGGDVENASSADYIMHFLTFAFKVIRKMYFDLQNIICYFLYFRLSLLLFPLLESWAAGFALHALW